MKNLQMIHRKIPWKKILALPVGHIKNLVAVGIVAGSVSVGADPLKQLVIPDGGDEIEAASSDNRVLVSAETTHVNRSIVQQEARIGPRQSPDTDWQSVDV